MGRYGRKGKGASFSKKSVIDYIFRETIAHHGIQGKGNLSLSKDELFYISEKKRILNHVLNHSPKMFFLSNSISNYLLIELGKTQYLFSKDSLIDKISYPLYIPDEYFKILDGAVMRAVVGTEEEVKLRILKGYKVCLELITLLREKVHKNLDSYLMSSDIKSQSKMQKNVDNEYRSFLTKLSDNEDDVRAFLESLNGATLLDKIRQRILPLEIDEKNKKISVEDEEHISVLGSFFETIRKNVCLFSIEDDNEKKEFLWHFMVFSPFSFSPDRLFSISPSEIMLHISPILSQKEDKFTYMPDEIFFKNYFLYRHLKQVKFDSYQFSQSLKKISILLSDDTSEMENLLKKETLWNITNEQNKIYLDVLKKLCKQKFDQVTQDKKLFLVDEMVAVKIGFSLIRKTLIELKDIKPTFEEKEEGGNVNLQSVITSELEVVICELTRTFATLYHTRKKAFGSNNGSNIELSTRDSIKGDKKDEVVKNEEITLTADEYVSDSVEEESSFDMKKLNDLENV